MLELSEIRKSYTMGVNCTEVLKGVSLKVDKGEMLSIMGPSGCGKSTLMNIIGLLDRPDSGSYSLYGKEIAYDDDDDLSHLRNRSIGFVFQQYCLLSRMTALDNAAIPLIYRGMSRKDAREKCRPFLERVGMSAHMHHRPNELSGGQQQRVAIARAIAGSPSIILADEPTGALDTKVGEEIMELFRNLNDEEGITIIMITHDPGIAAQCRRTVHMRDGMLSGA